LSEKERQNGRKKKKGGACRTRAERAGPKREETNLQGKKILTSRIEKGGAPQGVENEGFARGKKKTRKKQTAGQEKTRGRHERDQTKEKK